MRRASAPVHACTRLTIAWERYLSPPTTAATSQVNPVATTEPATDTSATPLTIANPLTRHVAAVADVAATDALRHFPTEQED
jgi:hypothetical protein